MKKVIQNIEYTRNLTDVDESIIQEFEESITKTDSSDVFIICNVFDSTQNFIKQEILSYDEVSEIVDEEDMISLIRDSVLKINESEETLKSGVYSIRFELYIDMFDMLSSVDNKFIVTEISPDRTEVRLTPLSNDVSFIRKFNSFKDYLRVNRDIDDSSYDGFMKYLPDHAEIFFSPLVINKLFEKRPSIFTNRELDFSILTDSLYGYIVSILRTQAYSEGYESDANRQAIDRASIIMIGLSEQYLAKKDLFLDDINKYGETLRNDYTSKLDAATTKAQRTGIANQFKQILTTQSRNIINNYMEEILNNIGDI